MHTTGTWVLIQTSPISNCVFLIHELLQMKMLIGILGTIVRPPFITQGCCEDQMDIILLSKWQRSRQRALVEPLLDSPCPEKRVQEGFTNSQVCLHWGASFLLTCSLSFLLPLWQNCVSGSPKEIADSTDSWKKGSQISPVLWGSNNWPTGPLIFLLPVLACQQT